MHHTVILGRPMRLAAIGLLSVCAHLAQAQSYTSRELKPPLGVRDIGCIVSGNHVLSDNGDVVGACTFFEGYYLSDLLPLFPASYFAYKPVVWRNNGAVQRLSVVARTATWPFAGMGIDGQGRVLANVSVATSTGTTLTPGGRLPTEQELGRTLWTGNTRAKWAPPIGFEGFKMIGWTSPAGRSLIVKSGGDGALMLAVTQGSTAQNVPPLPMASYLTEAVINDNGQLAVSIVIGEPRFYDESNVEQWFWNGAIWSRMVLPAIPTGGHWRPHRITDNGSVLLAYSLRLSLATGPASVLWQPDTGATELPGNLSSEDGDPGDLANNGERVGQLGVNLAARATLWRNGQAIDLSTLVKPPLGFAFTNALSVNKRGQILVRAVPIKPPALLARIMLLTPK